MEGPNVTPIKYNFLILFVYVHFSIHFFYLQCFIQLFFSLWNGTFRKKIFKDFQTSKTREDFLIPLDA